MRGRKPPGGGVDYVQSGGGTAGARRVPPRTTSNDTKAGSTAADTAGRQR
ncbi:hypothetical protein SRIMHP_22135 [Streptomyces rimosus subsp. rimosus]|uniref:Uncharacterized protein n=1 Tax=Streptomyces rimosus subsp. rimosus TaxID=132474 RepID=A0ABY3Z4X4_STRRM|nr:hypothetical protein SRIMR7_24770 [Streptomyces rimosus subsp. rimosus]UTH96829.1 hypothetical protein SRIMHP_22135 [Streptomyces rimosus subsp. rimosus]